MTLQRTPLYETHRAAGARLVDFAGWEMPVQYRGIIAEHAMVRTRAGLFDVSHMGQVEVCGAGALECLQWITANDVARLAEGRAQYNLIMLADGGIVDDVIIYKRSPDRFLVCVNASNRSADVEYLLQHRGTAEIVDQSAETGLLALQGPLATGTLAGLAGEEIAAVPSFGFLERFVAGHRCLLARTGYTGEDGWEIYCPAAAAAEIWDAILRCGAECGVGPAGLGARDTLRLEAALPLYGHEIDRHTVPFEARLGWVVHLDKGDFIAASALRRCKKAGPRRCLVGIAVPDGGVPRQGYAILHCGTQVGVVTSGTVSPTLGKGIALGYVEPKASRVGTEVAVAIRGRAVPGEVVSLPFHRRPAP